MAKLFLHTSLAAFIGLAWLTSCKPKPMAETKTAPVASKGVEQETPAETPVTVAQDSIEPWELVPDAPTEPEPITDPASASDFPGLGLREKIDRYCDAMRALSSRFSAKAHVHWESDTIRTIVLRDSLDTAAIAIRNQWEAFGDSAFKLIQAYKEKLASGAGDPANRPAMLANGPVTDSLSLAKLPKIQPSSFLKEKGFFFMGAGPFLGGLRTEYDTTVYYDLQGKPELRYCNDISRSTTRVMDMLKGFALAPVKTLDGERIWPGHHEDDCVLEKSVKGIGSLTHVLDRDLPVYFITTKGLVTARLAQVSDKLFESNQGCVSEQPTVCFGVSTLPKGEILGIFIPYEPMTITHCKVTRKRQMWTVDLTGDDVPELAGVSRSDEGVSGTIYNIIWYGNVSGAWMPIDSGEDLDCT